jgi:hypothetical protein
MLFRKNNGELIEIKKYDFPNDKLYYEKIMEIKRPILNSIKIVPFFNQVQTLPKLEKTF